jgi:hypothetical protein
LAASLRSVLEPRPESLRLSVLIEALGRIDRARRQLDRAVSAYRAAWEERERLNFTSGFVPDSIRQLEIDFEDAATFAVAAARQAIRGRNLLVDHGLNMPAVRNADAIVAARDLDEHWDEWKTLAPSQEGRPHLTIRAGRRWERYTDDALGGTGAELEPDGWWRVKRWQRLNLDALAEDLARVRAEVRSLEQELYEREYVDHDGAVALVGEAAWPTVRNAVRGYRMRDEVVRWPSRGVLAMADLLERYERDGPSALPGIPV